jgi:hypothetical protein
MVEKNLHKYLLLEAIEVIIETLSQALLNRDSQIIFIHGSSHGTAIVDYLDSEKFIHDCEEAGIVIVNKRSDRKRVKTFLNIELPSDIPIAIPSVNPEELYDQLKKNGRITLNE